MGEDGGVQGEGTLVIVKSSSRSVSMTQPPPNAGQSSRPPMESTR